MGLKCDWAFFEAPLVILLGHQGLERKELEETTIAEEQTVTAHIS